jgi:hypothetical protein
MQIVTIYEKGDLLTSAQAAAHFGYSRDYFRSMLQINDKAADPRLIRLQIKTDATWRKDNGSRARFVFEYDAIKAWYDAKQRRPSVKAKTWARRFEPNPIL